MKYLYHVVFTVCLLTITLYIPLATIVYFTPWYTLNTPSSSTIKNEVMTIGQRNLTLFFQHREKLSEKIWSKKDILHMHDVRKIYDTLFIVFLIALCIAYLTYKNAHINTSIKIVCATIIMSLFVLPFFSYFWTHIFHNILFDNDLWIMTPDDLSYHLFPLQFFINALTFIVIVALTLNILIYKRSKKKSQ